MWVFDAFVVDAMRTAGGRRQGGLSGCHPADLGATVIESLKSRAPVDPASFDDVIF
jgi:acetyl-CoA C-acetyltransferase